MTAHAWKATGVIGLIAGPLLLWSDTPALHDLIWIVTMSLAAGAVMWGVHLHRPKHPMTWRLLALSLGLFVVAVAVGPSALDLAPTAPRRLLGDGLNLVGYLLLGVLASRFVRYQTPKHDRDGLIDAIIVMVALTTVLWTVAFGESPTDGGLPVSSQLALGVALLVPAWVAALCVRLLITSGSRVISARLLGSSGLTLFVVTLLEILRGYVDGEAAQGTLEGAVNLLWLVSILLATAAALHPSMQLLTRPAPSAQDAVSTGRSIVLGVALVAVPIALLQTAGSVNVNIVIPVGGSAVLAVFILARFARLVSDRERARRDVTVRASHQAALSRLAADALSNHDITQLYHDAEELLTEAVDDAVVRLHGDPATSPVIEPSAVDTVWLPITGMDGPVAAIEVVPEPGEALDDEARQFLNAVADVLASAVQRRQVEVELEHRATHDPLTGLPNRVQLFDRLEHALLRRGDERVGILYVDLDGFKPINDTHGHEAGDRVLVTLAERMCGMVRAADTVARMAGDEFVLLIDPSTRKELTVVADRLLERLADPMDIDGITISMAASIGAVVSDPSDRHPEALLRRADAAMYEAKQDPDATVVVANGT